MAHKDGVLCDEGFKCKKCEDAWGKLTEIEQLTARVRELETQLAANNPLLDEAANRLDELEQQLAASQLHAEQLREALTKCSEQLTRLGYSANHADKALSLPRDISALDAYVAENVKEAMK